jgi:hypothetical protein
MSTYSSETYSSETYATEAAPPPVKKRGAPFSVFTWARPTEIDDQKAPKLESLYAISNIATIKREPLNAVIDSIKESINATSKIAVVRRNLLKLNCAIQVVSKAEIERQIEEVREIFQVYEITKKYTELKPLHRQQEAKHERLTWQANQHATNREYWAKAGYCNCAKFSHIHTLKDCKGFDLDEK